MKKNLLLLLLIGLFSVSIGALSADNIHHKNQTANFSGTIFTVNDANDVFNGRCDSTQCSLREAITNANANPGTDIIYFDFTTPATIQLDTPLPEITDTVVIDGITGTGSSCPTSPTSPANLLITLDGNGLSNANEAIGLQLDPGSEGSSIIGLNIVRFEQIGLQIFSSDNLVICNQFGLPNTDVGGYANGQAIAIEAGANNLIGGEDDALRNVIVGNEGIALYEFAQNTIIAGNYIGTDRTGSVGLGEEGAQWGIFVSGADNSFIGGTTAGNIIGGYTWGVLLENSPTSNALGTVIRSNNIGTDRTTTNPIPNSYGIKVVELSQLTIGGDPLDGNVIVHNEEGGIDAENSEALEVTYNTIYDNDNGIHLLNSTELTVAHNLVHTNSRGIFSHVDDIIFLGENHIYHDNTIHHNSSFGLRVYFADDTTISSNLIFSNGGDGIDLAGGSSTIELNEIYDNLIGVDVSAGLGHSIRMNSIYNNDFLGIDLGDLGVTPNDTNDDDTGSNNLQNFPVLTTADQGGSVSGSFQRTTSHTFPYTFDFYVNVACDDQLFENDPYGEGETWVGSIDVGLGETAESFDWSVNLPNLPPGSYLTATATDYQGNTSEFSNCIEVDSAEFIVDSTGTESDLDNNDGLCLTAANTCTLPAAIEQANAIDGAIIDFDFRQQLTVNLSDPLVVTSPILLGGFRSGSGMFCNSNDAIEVEINGQALSAGSHALTLAAGSDGSQLRNLSIINAPADGIHIESNDNIIACSLIGVSANGTTAAGNGDDGIEIAGGTNNLIGSKTNPADQNTIAGNGDDGITLTAGSNNTFIANNIIGDIAPNIDRGVRATSVSGLEILDNDILDNGDDAISFFSVSNAVISSNELVDNGSLTVGSGVRIADSQNISVGGSAENNGNEIHTNSGSGIYLIDTLAVNIRHNNIGTDGGNTFDGIHIDDNVTAVSVRKNEIANNNRNGIRVDNDSIGNEFSANSIHSNSSIGIDLHEDGVTANDGDPFNITTVPDIDSGGNGKQNYPEFRGTDASSGNIQFAFASTPSRPFTLEFFANSSCDGTHGEGETYLGALRVFTDNSGVALGFFNAVGLFDGGDFITATATNEATDGTSEFSECVQGTGVAAAVDLKSVSADSAPSPLYLFVLVLGVISLLKVRRRQF